MGFIYITIWMIIPSSRGENNFLKGIIGCYLLIVLLRRTTFHVCYQVNGPEFCLCKICIDDNSCRLVTSRAIQWYISNGFFIRSLGLINHCYINELSGGFSGFVSITFGTFGILITESKPVLTLNSMIPWILKGPYRIRTPNGLSPNIPQCGYK